MITMLSFFLIGCDTSSSELASVDAPRFAPNITWSVNDKSTSRYDRYIQQFFPHVVQINTHEVMIPLDEEFHSLTVNFHMSEMSVEDDIHHLVRSSELILRDVVPAVAAKADVHHKIDAANCIDTLRSVELYHVPCSTLNNETSIGYLQEDQTERSGNVVLGITLKDRHPDYTSTFAVAYCYDEMVNLSQKLIYERDHHFRETTLAHEMTHVWLDSCMPGATFLYGEEFEKAAWEFHRSYEKTAHEHHVSYPGVNESWLWFTSFFKRGN